MTRSTPQNPPTTTLIGMGETVLLRQDQTARAVVGSCIGLVLDHRGDKLAAAAHIVLPESAGRMEIPGQFADTAIPHLLALLEREGARRDGLVAKVVGGAQMFGRRPGTRQDREPDARGPMQIGEANLSAVTTILAELAIPLRGKSVGGTKGRKFSFCCNSGELMVEVAGEAPFIL